MKPEHAARIHVGTSGWSYPHWKGPFYPPEVRASQRLSYYAARFDTVEINSSFYRLPSRAALAAWSAAVPDGFRFAVKASRYITHMKKLADPKRSLAAFFARIAILGDKLGPVLFQLPPRWRVNLGRLDGFLGALSRDFRYAFEFRDRSWIDDRALDRLAAHGAAFCIYELDGYRTPNTFTADFAYVRLHGPSGAYRGSYDTATLAGWAGAFATWAAQGREIHCYFDNDEAGHAVKNAARLRGMVAPRATA